jgi:Sulfotransferase domain
MPKEAVPMPKRLLQDQRFRNLVPPRGKAAFAENRVLLVRVARRSGLRNVYHCCVHKTGSQWIRKVLADPAVYRASGLRTYAYQPRQRNEQRTRSYPEVRFDRAFPARRIVSPLYVTHAAFAAMPKPEPWRTFFVARDPRDVVVSWYFSTIASHPTSNIPGMLETRDRLRALDEPDGLIASIEHLAANGLFDALRSWAGVDEPDVLVLRYEELIGPDADAWWSRLFEHCDVRLDAREREALIARYSFRSLSGRDPGEEDTASKFRKGVAGDWRNHFTPAVAEAFRRRTSDLVGALAYEE